RIAEVLRQIQKVVTVGQKPRTAMYRSAFDGTVDHRDRSRVASSRGHSAQAANGVGRKQDRAVRTPRSTAAVRRIRNLLRPAAGDVNPFQLPAREERHPL